MLSDQSPEDRHSAMAVVELESPTKQPSSHSNSTREPNTCCVSVLVHQDPLLMNGKWGQGRAATYIRSNGLRL